MEVPLRRRPGVVRRRPARPQVLARAAKATLHDAVTQLPDNGVVRTEERFVEGAAGLSLIEAAEGATMLVVGSRGRGEFAGLILDSTSQWCIQHAPCPVLVVRGS